MLEGLFVGLVYFGFIGLVGLVTGLFVNSKSGKKLVNKFISFVEK